MEEIKCKRCGGVNKIKAGAIRGQQRYVCKGCGCKYTNTNKRGYDDEFKKEAIKYYLEGIGFRRIERLLKVSNVTVMRWVRKLGKSVKQIHINNIGKKKVKIMEIDEMCAYVGKKNNIYGYGMLLIGQKEGISPSQLVIVPVKRQTNYTAK